MRPVGELGEADSETELTAWELAELAYKALMDGDPELMAALARAAVSRFAGMEPGPPCRRQLLRVQDPPPTAGRRDA